MSMTSTVNFKRLKPLTSTMYELIRNTLRDENQYINSVYGLKINGIGKKRDIRLIVTGPIMMCYLVEIKLGMTILGRMPVNGGLVCYDEDVEKFLRPLGKETRADFVSTVNLVVKGVLQQSGVGNNG